MKQMLYMIATVLICAALIPVLLITVVWQWVWDALDTACVAWIECGKLR